MSDVALVMAYDQNGHLLFGKRKDNGKYTIPAGHVEWNESPEEGARRELWEEAGLKAESLSKLGTEVTKYGTVLHFFSAYVHGTPHGQNDPDQECGDDWEFVDVSQGLPSRISKKLVGDENHSNMVRKIFKDKEKLSKGEPKETVPTIIMVRHGATALNDPNNERLRGWKNVPLSEQGIKEAQKASKELENEDVGALYCSDLDRATITAEIVGKPHGMVPIQDANLRPWDQGEMTGKSVQEYVPVMLDFIQNHPNERIPGSTESFNEFKNRSIKTLQKYAEMAINSPGTTVLVAHSRNTRVLRGWVMAGGGNDINVQPLLDKPDLVEPGGYLKVQFINGRWIEEKQQEITDTKIKKSETDEIATLLQNANPIERKLALHLHGIRPRHLIQGALDPEPNVHKAAIDHPLFDTHAARGVLSVSKDSDGKYPVAQHLYTLGKPFIEPAHLHQAYINAISNLQDEIVSAIAGHPAATSDLINQIFANPEISHADKLAIASHKNASQEVLHKILQDVTSYPGKQTIELGKSAVANESLPIETVEKLARRCIGANVPPELLEVVIHALTKRHIENFAQELHNQARVHPGPAHSALRAAVLNGPGVSEEDLANGVMDPSPEVQGTLLKHPNLNSKHIDAILDRALKVGDKETISKVADHPNFSPWHVTKMLQFKPLQKSEGNFDGPSTVSSSVVRDMLGAAIFDTKELEAAKFLSGGAEAMPETIRQAYFDAEGNPELTAILAYGLPMDEGTMKALKALINIVSFRKSELHLPTAKDVVAFAKDGEDVAEAIKRAYADSFVFEVVLSGKHSKGALLARDVESKETWLLKPGSGSAGEAAGLTEEKASQSAREAAFWHCTEVFGVDDSFCRAELIMIDGKEYAALKMLGLDYQTLDHLEKTDNNIGRSILEPYLRDGYVHKWAVVDFILGQADRHSNNIMVNKERVVKMIDNGSTFAGKDFDPANDKSSFVPGYLRAWAPKNFSKLTTEEKLQFLPKANESIRAQLMQWFEGINIELIKAVCYRYSIDFQATIKRHGDVSLLLAKLPLDEAVNRLWVTV